MFMRAKRTFSTGRGLVKVGNILPQDHEMVEKYPGHFEEFDMYSGGLPVNLPTEQAEGAPAHVSRASRLRDERLDPNNNPDPVVEPEDPTAAEDEDSEDTAESTEGDQPAKNAKKAVWVEYAQAQGVDVEGKSRDEIAEMFE